MIIPPAFQVDAPFGVDVGPVSPLLMRLVARIIVCHAVRTDLRAAMCRRGAQTHPAFFPVVPDAEFDSFLTIGLDGKAERTLYGRLNYRTAARTLFLRPYLAHFCPVFSRFFAVFSVVTPGFQKVAPKDRGVVP